MIDCSIAINKKLPKTGESIFAKMSALAKKSGALNMAQGFPDFPIDPVLIDLVHQKMQEGHNQYAPKNGVPQLQQAISNKVAKLYGTQYNPDSEVLVTAGATQGIYATITALIKEGDEVIIFTPAYDCYEPAIELAGGRIINIQLKHPDFRIDWEEVKKLVTRKTKMIILNSPHNPSGSIITEEGIEELKKITADQDIVILSDEVYEHIIFDGAQHHSMSKYPELASKSVVIASFGKVFHHTGWKMGYCLAPKEILAEIAKVHQFIVFSVNTPVQLALAEYLEQEHKYLELPQFFEQKRNTFLKEVEGSKFKVVPTSGTYFQLLDYSEISSKSDTDFANYLTIEHKIASIPISVFYHQKVDSKFLRFCFAKSDETLAEAGKILRSI